MDEIKFDALLAALPKRNRSTGQRLRIAHAPNPFVAPTLRVLQPKTENPLEAEVIFIKASAAVGKSTIANYLSGARGIPLLDLATIPVSTGSLKALLLDVSGAGNPIKSFHAGKLPIIVDALDEGRLLSGEQGLESFLETTGEFLNEDRSCTNRPTLCSTHPWNEISSTLPAPYDTTPEDTLIATVIAVAQRTLPGANLVLNKDFTPILDDPHLRWAARQYPTELPELIKLLVKHGMASSAPLGASDGGTKIKVQFEFGWWDLVSALENPAAFPSWADFIQDARRRIHA